MVCRRVFTLLLSCLLFLTLQCTQCAEIIDGKEVEPHSMPFMALLEDNNSNLVCGGILISPRWVLTAAHCQQGIKRVSLGVHHRRQKEPNRQVMKVKRTIPHECYDDDEKVNDLMLLQLDRAVKRTKAVEPLPLDNNAQDPRANSTCLVAGWDKKSPAAKTMSDVLRSVNVTVVDRVTCNSRPYYNYNPLITLSMICAGSDGKNQADTCQGDSGGPLLCGRKLVGITSFGTKCGLKEKPGVYTFLSTKHLTWIAQKMKKHASDE